MCDVRAGSVVWVWIWTLVWFPVWRTASLIFTAVFVFQHFRCFICKRLLYYQVFYDIIRLRLFSRKTNGEMWNDRFSHTSGLSPFVNTYHQVFQSAGSRQRYLLLAMLNFWNSWGTAWQQLAGICLVNATNTQACHYTMVPSHCHIPPILVNRIL